MSHTKEHTRDQLRHGDRIGQHLNHSKINVGTQIFNMTAHSIATNPTRAYLILISSAVVIIAILWQGPKVRVETSINRPPRFSDLEHEMWRRVEPFQERNLSMSELQNKLAKPASGIDLLHAVAISGPAGSGKTQLVFDYVAKHRGLYRTQIYLDAETTESIHQSFDKSASRYSLDQEDSIGALKDFLRSKTSLSDTWLVIMDNANDLSMPLHRYVPNGSRGTVIVVSTDRHVYEILSGSTLRVDVRGFEICEGISLLQKFTEGASDYLEPSTVTAAMEIVRDLHEFPFAIAVAGARIRADVFDGHSAHAAMLSFRDDFSKHAESLAQQTNLARMSGYQKTIWTIWDSTIELIERTSPLANSSLLAHFLASLSFEGEIGAVPYVWFSLAAAGLPAVDRALISPLPDWLVAILSINNIGCWDAFNLDEALRPLLRYGLVQKSRILGAYQIKQHGLVRWRLSRGTDTPDWKARAYTFLLCVSLGIQSDQTPLSFSPMAMPVLPLSRFLNDMQHSLAPRSQRYSWTVHSTGIFLANEAWISRQHWHQAFSPADFIASSYASDANFRKAMFWTLGSIRQPRALAHFQMSLLHVLVYINELDSVEGAADIPTPDQIRAVVPRLAARTYLHMLTADTIYGFLTAIKGNFCDFPFDSPLYGFCFRRHFALIIWHASKGDYGTCDALAKAVVALGKSIGLRYPIHILVDALDILKRLHDFERGEVYWSAQAKIVLLRALWLHAEVLALSARDTTPDLDLETTSHDLERNAKHLSGAGLKLMRATLLEDWSTQADADLAKSSWEMITRLTGQTMVQFATVLRRSGQRGGALLAEGMATNVTYSYYDTSEVGLPGLLWRYCYEEGGGFQWDCIESLDKDMAVVCADSFPCSPFDRYDFSDSRTCFAFDSQVLYSQLKKQHNAFDFESEYLAQVIVDANKRLRSTCESSRE